MPSRLDADRIKVAGECQLWTGTKRHHGYGGIEIDKKKYYVHRVAYEDAYGPIPKGHVVRHRCGNTSCVEPKHLTTGTQKQNCEDTVAMGKSTRGIKNPQAKLTPEDVLEIKRLVNEEGFLQKEVAEQFNVSKTTIGFVVNNKRWSYT